MADSSNFKDILSGAAIVISVFALYFSRRSWKDSNRPIVTLRVSSVEMDGNISTPLTLVVDNTGNRPAVDIVITWDGTDYREAFNAPDDDDRRRTFDRKYDEGVRIPILSNGRSLMTSFGFIGTQYGDQIPTWKADTRFRMRVAYADLDGRKYAHSVPLIMADEHGFGGGTWKPSDR